MSMVRKLTPIFIKATTMIKVTRYSTKQTTMTMVTAIKTTTATEKTASIKAAT